MFTCCHHLGIDSNRYIRCKPELDIPLQQVGFLCFNVRNLLRCQNSTSVFAGDEEAQLRDNIPVKIVHLFIVNVAPYVGRKVIHVRMGCYECQREQAG